MGSIELNNWFSLSEYRTLPKDRARDGVRLLCILAWVACIWNSCQNQDPTTWWQHPQVCTLWDLLTELYAEQAKSCSEGSLAPGNHFFDAHLMPSLPLLMPPVTVTLCLTLSTGLSCSSSTLSSKTLILIWPLSHGSCGIAQNCSCFDRSSAFLLGMIKMRPTEKRWAVWGKKHVEHRPLTWSPWGSLSKALGTF